jgi:hypothetical protein
MTTPPPDAGAMLAGRRPCCTTAGDVDASIAAVLAMARRAGERRPAVQ